MAENEKFTLDEFIDAIKGSAGIKATIMRRLGCRSRNTVDNYLKRYATAQAAYDEEKETIGDAAESVVIKAIRNEDVEVAKWYLVKKHQDRGYGEKSQIDHRITDVSKLSDDELDAIVKG